MHSYPFYVSLSIIAAIMMAFPEYLISLVTSLKRSLNLASLSFRSSTSRTNSCLIIDSRVSTSLFMRSWHLCSHLVAHYALADAALLVISCLSLVSKSRISVPTALALKRLKLSSLSVFKEYFSLSSSMNPEFNRLDS